MCYWYVSHCYITSKFNCLKPKELPITSPGEDSVTSKLEEKFSLRKKSSRSKVVFPTDPHTNYGGFSKTKTISITFVYNLTTIQPLRPHYGEYYLRSPGVAGEAGEMRMEVGMLPCDYTSRDAAFHEIFPTNTI